MEIISYLIKILLDFDHYFIFWGKLPNESLCLLVGWHVDRLVGLPYIHFMSSHTPCLTSAYIGAWKCNFPTDLGNYDRQTDRPTHTQTNGSTYRFIRKLHFQKMPRPKKRTFRFYKENSNRFDFLIKFQVIS